MGRAGRAKGALNKTELRESLREPSENSFNKRAEDRRGANPKVGMFLVGHESRKNFGSGGVDKKLSQTEAMLKGVLGWDWNKSKESQLMEPGDTVFIRPNGSKEGKIAGYFTVGEKIVLTVPSIKELIPDLEQNPIFWAPAVNKKTGKQKTNQAGDLLFEINLNSCESFLRENHAEIMNDIDQAVDSVMKDTNGDYYPRERLLENILGDIFAKNNTFTFIKIENPQTLSDFADERLVGGVRGGLGIGAVVLNGSEDASSSSRLKRSTALVADKERQRDKPKLITDKKTGERRKETPLEHEARLEEKVLRAAGAAEAAERLMRATEENRSSLANSSGQ